MLKEERHRVIINEVELHNRILLSDIAEQIGVSMDTIRRDVKELDADKQLKKVHGGAIALGFTNYATENKNIYALEDKIKIATKALSLINTGNTILIHGGTTCLELAKLIPNKLEITCFTTSLAVALELLTKKGVDVFFIGGRLSKDSQISIGANAIHQLLDITFDYSFIGTGYVDINYGLTEFDLESVQVKKAIIKSSKKTVLLSISEKLNSKHRYKTCEINAINTMITELDPDDMLLENFRKQDIRLL
ncbi:DeoR/GlpR family DNA-binding transcription regulator [Cellulophaga tyrosinoxydans]|uniref:Transcriptional regulator, DeoR family n=1 Tax=Cellulophaga tyrosinoxydans TaxID=504486 RepID=A0A1W2AB57_9FLAO|nr:DeoR/GlpR family DNA-binding transcription regulator [Cellulophaga tyrosinoxydans]SMC57823.1 transcriptional regulator, DeoR family [Cellulophaga tyrosinoxydans]